MMRLLIGMVILSVANTVWAQAPTDVDTPKDLQVEKAQETGTAPKDGTDPKDGADPKDGIDSKNGSVLKAEASPADTAGNGATDATSTADDTPSPSAVPSDRMPTLQLNVHPKEASLGEVVTWQLTVKRKKEDAVHLEGGASFGGLEIKSKDKTETPAVDGWVQETLSVALVGFDTGDITIPKQKLTVVDFEGHIAEVITDESFVTIKSLIANEPEPTLKEDAGPGEIVMEKDYLLLWILGMSAGIGLVILLTLVGRKLWTMRKPKTAPPPPPPRPAEEIANEKLEELRRSNLLAEDEIKEFHVRLSEAVREYIGNRFDFDSLELSSEELIQAVRKINLTRAEYDIVIDFLGETDLVKFAKVLPTVQESEDLLTQSFGFVERTTPKTAPAENTSHKSGISGKEADRA